MTDMEKGRPRHSGDPSANSSNVHPRDYVMTAGQATEPVGGLCYPAPGPGYVAVFDDDGPREIWDVVGFDRAGNPLIEVGPRGQKTVVRADTSPRYLYQGWAHLLGVKA